MNKDLRIKHFRAYNEDGSVNAYGGMTVAYKWEEQKGGHIVEVATAVCSRRELFSKKVGREQALGDFDINKTIYFPVVDKNITATLIHLGKLVNLTMVNGLADTNTNLTVPTDWLLEVQDQLQGMQDRMDQSYVVPMEDSTLDTRLEFTAKTEKAARAYVGQFGEFNIPDTFSFKELFSIMVEASKD